MALNQSDKEKWCEYLDKAAMELYEVEPVTDEVKDLSLEDAYAIQKMGIARRVERGEKVVGYKMGLTSKAKMQQMGVDAPIYGVLTDVMVGKADGVPASKMIHPKMEPEIAFVTKSELRKGASDTEVAEAIDYVCAAVEVIDSRYRNFRFTLPDVIADNASSIYFVLGEEKRSLTDLDVANLGMTFSKNGESVGMASSAAILGNPLDSFKMLLELLDGETLPAGSIVLAGASTAATAIAKGDTLKLEVQNLGVMELSIQ